MDIKFKKTKQIKYEDPPLKHAEITCKKCGMGNVYVTKQCYFCKEPFKIEGEK